MSIQSLAPYSPYRSVWSTTVDKPEFPRLMQDMDVDVCIVGAGIAGLTTAYELATAGRSVAVLDDGPVCGGNTQMTTAHLTNVIDDGFVNIERWHGKDASRLAAQSHGRAIARIEEIADKEGIDCDFQRVDGFLFNPPGQIDDTLKQEFEAARRAGHTGAEMVPRLPWASFDSGPAVRFPNQGQFHPLKYFSGLSRAIVREGGRIFADTHADEFKGGHQARVRAGGHSVTCRAVVVATNTPVNNKLVIHSKQGGYLTYVIAAPIDPAEISPGLYWDTLAPYHYIRTHRVELDGKPVDMIIVGGDDHKTGQARDEGERHAGLELWARERFKTMGEVALRWSGQVMETGDGLGFIGRNPYDHDNVFVATGDSGQGMTHGTIAGMLLSDLILGRSTPWERVYDPARLKFAAYANYATEALNGASKYVDWLTPGDVGDVSKIGPDEGAIVRRGLHRVAAYRDPDGKLHEMSAVCKHFLGSVRFNPGAKTWDCPTHCSRYGATGEAIQGPTNDSLSRLDDTEDKEK